MVSGCSQVCCVATEHLSGSRQIVRPPFPRFLAWIRVHALERSLFKEVSVCFLPEAHGKGALDGHFGCMLQWVNSVVGAKVISSSKDCLTQPRSIECSSSSQMRLSRARQAVPGAVVPSRRPAATRKWTSARHGTMRSFASAAPRCRPARDSLGSASRCGSRISVSIPKPSSPSHLSPSVLYRGPLKRNFCMGPPALAQRAQVQRYLLRRALSAVSPPLSRHVCDGIFVWVSSSCCFPESLRQTFGQQWVRACRPSSVQYICATPPHLLDGCGQ